MQQAMVKREDLTTSAPRAAEAWDQERDSLLILLASSPPPSPLLPPYWPSAALTPALAPPYKWHRVSGTRTCTRAQQAAFTTSTLRHAHTQTHLHTTSLKRFHMALTPRTVALLRTHLCTSTHEPMHSYTHTNTQSQTRMQILHRFFPIFLLRLSVSISFASLPVEGRTDKTSDASTLSQPLKNHPTPNRVPT